MPFRHVYGHEPQIQILQKTLGKKRTAHAYLFSGISAIGKKTLALEFIKAIHCEKTDMLNDSCGECPSCRKIQRQSHPDVFVIEPNGQYIRIDSIRQMQERTTCRPLEAKQRAFIIDDADRMNEQSANALLKMLEEPTASNMLMLVTSRPYSLPQTIISRCQHLRFNPLSMDAVARFLVSEKTINEQDAALLAVLSGGSIGSALELNREDMISYRTDLINILSAIDGKDSFSVIHLASFLGQKKKEIMRGLNILNAFFRDVLVCKETGENNRAINQDSASLIAAYARRLSGEQILQNMEQIEKTGMMIEQNVNKSLTLEAMAFKLNY
jgi:DNA polymerase-3 subunit delta'